MRLPSCLSTNSTDDTRPSPLLSSSTPGRASVADLYHTWDEPENETTARPGCIFCDVSKEKGFAVIHEDGELIAFHDRSPRAKVHLLIIPRYHVADSCKDLTKKHVPLLDRMITLANTLSRSLDPSAAPKLGFHIPPFSSVPHLHLHVLIPPYTFLGRLQYPISHRRKDEQGREAKLNEGHKGSVKGWSWFVEAGQARDILSRGGSIKLGRS